MSVSFCHIVHLLKKRKADPFKVVNYALRIDMIKLRFMLRFQFKVGWDRII